MKFELALEIEKKNGINDEDVTQWQKIERSGWSGHTQMPVNIKIGLFW